MEVKRPSRQGLLTFAKYFSIVGFCFFFGMLIGLMARKSECNNLRPKKAQSAVTTFNHINTTTSNEPIDLEPQKGGRGGGGHSAAGKVKAGDALVLVLGAGLMAVVAGEL